MNVAVYGASNNKDRYAYLAQKMLVENGYKVFPVHPVEEEVQGIPAVRKLAEIGQPVDTVTIYVSARHQASIADDLLSVKPRRVVFNPGTENPELAARLIASGVKVVEACSLVMMRTGQW